jgi:hypothetical protein
MAEPQLSVRSAKARDLAHRLARREKRSIADIVERALESLRSPRSRARTGVFILCAAVSAIQDRHRS